MCGAIFCVVCLMSNSIDGHLYYIFQKFTFCFQVDAGFNVTHVVPVNVDQ